MLVATGGIFDKASWSDLRDALPHDENETFSFFCNSPSNLGACSIPTVMLFSRAFCSNDILFPDGLDDFVTFPCNYDLLIWSGEVGMAV